MASTEVEQIESTTSDRHIVPVFVVDFDDERSRSRLREAAFVSVIFHLILFIILLLSPKWLPRLHPVSVATSADLMRDRELTYLDLPKDQQQLAKPEKTNIISDKDRAAMSRQPRPDRKLLDELRDARRQGRPGAPGSMAPPAPQAAQPQSAAQQPQAPQHPANDLARLESPRQSPSRPNFSTGPQSAGSAIDQATRAAASARNSGGGGGGDLGDYGLGVGRRPTNAGNMEILSDTLGVDFAPYLQRMRISVYKNWVVPEVAYPPLRKNGKLVIEFVILKNGEVSGMKLISSSGDVSLDRAAWGSITGSNPFPPLPSDFGGPYLAMRCTFVYNPDRTDQAGIR